MSLSRTVAMVAAGACMLGPAGAAAWRLVPGASELEMALASMQLEGTRVVVWLRSPGRHPLVPELAAAGRSPSRVHRTALRAEFDCGRRTMRVLAASAYDGAGTPVAMWSTPGPMRPVEGADLGWTYDAVCEAARAERRL
ncbi:MAG TPA: hypothetical protein VIL30_21650 [Ramlibacter sp.]|jgi:hypothetical protein